MCYYQSLSARSRFFVVNIKNNGLIPAATQVACHIISAYKPQTAPVWAKAFAKVVIFFQSMPKQKGLSYACAFTNHSHNSLQHDTTGQIHQIILCAALIPDMGEQ